MKLPIIEAQSLAINYLVSLGLSTEECNYIVENLIDAELAGKRTHGFIRLLSYKKKAEKRSLNTKYQNLDVISETVNSLYINGHNKLGYSIIYRSLKVAFDKIKASKIIAVGLKDLGETGYIGSYARKATEHNLIFIGFNNSPGALVPYGARKALWGTNPITIGIPTNNIPIILDMASSIITWGDLLLAKNEGVQIQNKVAIDNNGNMTTNPESAIGGGLLPFSEHKGSGLALIIEILAGALTNSRVGYSVPGGWGSFYILVDPTIFRSLSKFKKDINTSIVELKNSPKSIGFKEIFFPGEQSYKLRTKHLKQKKIEINDRLYRSFMCL